MIKNTNFLEAHWLKPYTSFFLGNCDASNGIRFFQHEIALWAGGIKRITTSYKTLPRESILTEHTALKFMICGILGFTFAKQSGY